MLENAYQAKLIKRIKSRFPDCVVYKTNPNYIQGVPDLLVLFKDRWAALECKKSEHEPRRPNQEYYISKMNDMSYASFIYPENEEEVLNEVQRAFES